MHLAFLTPEFPHPLSTPSGGLGTSIKNFAEGLHSKDISVTIFIYGQNQDKILEQNGIKLHFIKQRNYPVFGWYRYRKYLQNYLNREISRNKIDIIEAPDWTGITAFMKLKCMLVVRFHGSDTYFCHLENRPQKKKNFWFEKNALRGADHFISVSQFTAETTRKLFDIKKPITIISNSVNPNIFRPNSNKIVTNTILYFGSIIRKKGVLELAEIFNIIIEKKPEVRLILAGKDVPDKITGKSTIQLVMDALSPAAQKNTDWLGALLYKEVLEQVSKANVIALPSFAEALPMTWLEAMAMEKALVTSNIGWAKEIMVDGKTGFMENPKNHLLYARKILELINNTELAERFGKASRKRILTHFSTNIIMERNIQFYKSIISVS